MKIGLRVYTFLGVCLKVFNEGSLAVGASQDVLEEVQHQVMSYLLDERLNKLEEVAQVHRYEWDDNQFVHDYMYSYQCISITGYYMCYSMCISVHTGHLI